MLRKTGKQQKSFESNEIVNLHVNQTSKDKSNIHWGDQYPILGRKHSGIKEDKLETAYNFLEEFSMNQNNRTKKSLISNLFSIRHNN